MGEKKPYLIVLLIQCIYTGMFLVSKAALNDGFNSFIFAFYRQAVSSLFLIPFALFFEWKTAPRLSFLIFFKIFMLALFGVTLTINVYGVALVYTSPTLAAATSNSLPVITFVLAVLLKMEVLRLKTISGTVKLGGVLLCLSGALTLALFKGPHLKLLCFHHLFGPQETHHTLGHGPTWIKGCFLMLLSNVSWASWLVLQGGVVKCYPSKLLFTTIQSFLGAIQTFVIAIAIERNPSEWKLGWDLRLLAVVYCGVMVAGVSNYLQTWVIEKKGPVFLSVSTPLNMIFTLFCSAILLCEAISLGSILGGMFLIGGLYSVLWGKTREQKIEEEKNSLQVADVEKVCPETKVVPI